MLCVLQFVWNQLPACLITCHLPWHLPLAMVLCRCTINPCSSKQFVRRLWLQQFVCTLSKGTSIRIVAITVQLATSPTVRGPLHLIPCTVHVYNLIFKERVLSLSFRLCFQSATLPHPSCHPFFTACFPICWNLPPIQPCAPLYKISPQTL